MSTMAGIDDDAADFETRVCAPGSVRRPRSDPLRAWTSRRYRRSPKCPAERDGGDSASCGCGRQLMETRWTLPWAKLTTRRLAAMQEQFRQPRLRWGESWDGRWPEHRFGCWPSAAISCVPERVPAGTLATVVGCGELATGGLAVGGLATAGGTGVRPAGWPEAGALARLVVWDEPGLRPWMSMIRRQGLGSRKAE